MSRRNLICACLLAALLIAFGLTSVAAISGKNATVDEPDHLGAAWLQYHWLDFRCNPEDPPLWKYVVGFDTPRDMLHLDPVKSAGLLKWGVSAGKLFRDDLYSQGAQIADADFFAARRRLLGFGIALGVVIAAWSWRWGGPIAAVVATAAYCLDPNFLAHTVIIKNDVSMSLFFTALMFAVWLLGDRATFVRWLSVSLLLGAALTTKFSGILAIPMLGLALLCRALIPRPWPLLLKWTASTFAQRLAAAVSMGCASLLVAYVFIWAVYGFRYSISRDPNAPYDMSVVFGSYISHAAIEEHHAPADVTGPQVEQWTRQWKPDLVFRAGQWALAHHPLPEGWIVGFLFTYGTAQSRNSFLLDQLSQTGWWYYFPLAMLFKTPVATLAALLLAVVFVLHSRFRKHEKIAHPWPILAASIAPALYMAFAMKTHLNIGLRHILPVYPFLFIFLGVAAARACAQSPRLATALCVVLVAGLAAETAAAYPNYIAFFNAPAQARGPVHLLSDSNLDWGQDLKTLGQWQKDHPEKTVCLYYFGTADPRDYGIKYFVGGGGRESPFPSRQQMATMHVVIAISATELQETYSSGSDRMFWPELRNAQPSEILGNSIYLYELN
jgi:hypothetical protein